MEVISQLQELGFSKYEAQAYVALLRESPLNGYELAKASGIPRPNIYTILQKLEESGAVMRLTLPNGIRYAPVPANELLAKLQRRYHQSLEAASASLKQVEVPTNLEYVMNVRGYAEMLEQAQVLVGQTEEHLLLSIWPKEAEALAGPLHQAQERGVKITTLCLRGCPQPCPACQGSVFRYAIAPANGSRWLVTVSDARELLAGEILPSSSSPPDTSGSSAASVRTRQRMLVNLAGSYIQNSIALAAILTSFGNRLFSETDPQLLNALNELYPLHTQGPWLEVMQRMLRMETKDL